MTAALALVQNTGVSKTLAEVLSTAEEGPYELKAFCWAQQLHQELVKALEAKKFELYRVVAMRDPEFVLVDGAALIPKVVFELNRPIASGLTGQLLITLVEPYWDHAEHVIEATLNCQLIRIPKGQQAPYLAREASQIVDMQATVAEMGIFADKMLATLLQEELEGAGFLEEARRYAQYLLKREHTGGWSSTFFWRTCSGSCNDDI